MKNICSIVLALVMLLFLNFCKKKEEPKPKEEVVVTNQDSKPVSDDSEPAVVEIPNPTIPSPQGFKNIKETIGDLDGDKEEELVVVYDTGKKGDMGTEREIHIFEKVDGKWKLHHKSAGAVLPSQGGGMMGNPFENISIENRTLVIQHFGGSREKWNYTHRYRFQNDNWTLIGATVIFGAPCESSSTYDYNLSTGKVDVTLSKEVCNENGEPKGKPKVTRSSFTVKETKPILMDGFIPGETEVKIPSSKDKTFFF